MTSNTTVNDAATARWYHLQKKIQGWNEISADQGILDLVESNDWCVDVSYAHDNLRRRLAHRISCRPDFFVVSHLQLGKLPIETITDIVRQQFDSARCGGYVALLSYYLNSIRRYDCMGDTYSQTIDLVLRQLWEFSPGIENVSTMTDYPILNALRHERLIEGTNFLFVHGNVRYFLWK